MTLTGILVALGVWVTVYLALPSYSRLLAEGGLARPNYRGIPIPVSTGLLPALVAAIGSALIGILGNPLGQVTATLVLTAVLVGLLDDTAGDRRSTGLRGHFKALLQGQLSTGAVKAIIIPIIALVAVASLGRPLLWTLVDTALIALVANTINLLDVRPGRAVKGVLLLLLVAATGGLGAAGWELWFLFLAALIAYAPVDFRGRAMLGDSGSNAFGIAAGWLCAVSWPPIGRLALLAAAVGIHLLSERSSLSDLIERSPLLSAIDRLGRLKGRG